MSDEPKYLEVQHEEPEPWHRHSVAEGAPQEEHLAHVSIPALAVAWFVLTGFLVVAIAFVIIYFHGHIYAKQRDNENTEWHTEIALPYREQALRSLDTIAWESESEGAARVPVSLAMDRIVEQYHRNTTGFGTGEGDQGN